MKKISLILILCSVLFGCGKIQNLVTEDNAATLEAFNKELNTATLLLVSKIQNDPSAANIDEAQKNFDERKANLKSKFDVVKNSENLKTNSEAKKKLEDNVKVNSTMLRIVGFKNAAQLDKDKEAKDKLKKLIAEFEETFKM